MSDGFSPEGDAFDEPAGADTAPAGSAPEVEQVQDAPGPDGPAHDAEAVSDAIDELAEELDELAVVTAQRDDYLDSLRRLQAEFENFRKRIERQQRETVDRAAEALVLKLLPVLDTADLAITHGGGDEVKQVADALYDALARDGLERVKPEGEPFNPEFHDAVLHEPSDEVEHQQVSEVLRAGYLWKGRVLRPAMVKVKG
jgi:molecular chaperone GrpE